MKASERLLKELKSRIHYYKLYKNFDTWQPHEFGLVDKIVDEQKEWERKHYGYYQVLTHEKIGGKNG